MREEREGRETRKAGKSKTKSRDRGVTVDHGKCLRFLSISCRSKHQYGRQHHGADMRLIRPFLEPVGVGGALSIPIGYADQGAKPRKPKDASQ